MHFPFLVRACHHCRAMSHAHPHGESPAGPDSGDCLATKALKTCLRGQTFFSLGLRFLYLFIPLVRAVARVGIFVKVFAQQPGRSSSGVPRGDESACGHSRLLCPHTINPDGTFPLRPRLAGDVDIRRHLAAGWDTGGGHLPLHPGSDLTLPKQLGRDSMWRLPASSTHRMLDDWFCGTH